MRPSVKERARAFVAKARPAIAGQNGHDATFAVACGLVVGFGLNDADAWELLQQYNGVSCQPAWSEKELRRKLAEARKQADRDPSAVGKLAEQDSATYTGPRLPANNTQPTPAAKKPAKAGSPAGNGARTVRTPLFKVNPAGAGRSCATSRTLRTVFSYSKPYGGKSEAENMDWSREQASEPSKPSEPVRTVRTPEKAAPSTTAPVARPARRVVPVSERVDVTRIWADGHVDKKTWKQSDFHRIGNINDHNRAKTK